MAIRGRVWKYGDDVNTDVIFPGKYTYTVTDPEEMAAHALEDLDPRFAKEVKPGDVIVGGKNFGCGSSREQAAFCLKYAGLGAVIAISFSRIFFRNAINAGLPAITCSEVVSAVEDGDEIEVDFEVGVIRTKGEEFSFPPLPPEVLGIMKEGGLIPYLRKKLGLEKKGE
ncbi:MAG: 3-isopropylmalate dehydratase small subunit [Acidobacteria bacterium]|nr:3-isopropylmalate dehydratase small subunit [Acidobacteriota bacterium]